MELKEITGSIVVTDRPSRAIDTVRTRCLANTKEQILKAAPEERPVTIHIVIIQLSPVGAICKKIRMPNTYSQIYIQIVFAVKGRENLILSNHREQLQKFITGIIKKRNAQLIAIYCMPDHTHILIRMNVSISLSELTRDIKAGSSKFINDNRWIHGKFSWQEGYGAFSYSHSHINNVIDYIHNQESHHKKRTFKEEYLEFLKKFEVKYEDRFLFGEV